MGGMTPQEMCGYTYGSEELDALIDQVQATPDPEQAQPIFWEIDQVMHDDIPSVSVVAPAQIHAWNSKLHGIPDPSQYDLQAWHYPERWWMEQ